jgi:hypothetical protein
LPAQIARQWEEGWLRAAVPGVDGTGGSAITQAGLTPA